MEPLGVHSWHLKVWRLSPQPCGIWLQPRWRQTWVGWEDTQLVSTADLPTCLVMGGGGDEPSPTSHQKWLVLWYEKQSEVEFGVGFSQHASQPSSTRCLLFLVGGFEISESVPRLPKKCAFARWPHGGVLESSSPPHRSNPWLCSAYTEHKWTVVPHHRKWWGDCWVWAFPEQWCHQTNS